MMSNLLSFDRLNISTIVYGINIYASTCSTLNKDYITNATESREDFKRIPFLPFSCRVRVLSTVLGFQNAPFKNYSGNLYRLLHSFFFGFSSNPYRTTTGYQTEIKLTFKLSRQDYHRISDRN